MSACHVPLPRQSRRDKLAVHARGGNGQRGRSPRDSGEGDACLPRVPVRASAPTREAVSSMSSLR
ncbi:Hypothetical protein AA314_05804 [Archangium gephyra]|uniref:Uncharacterized protein n=1 Tax=Archangium gephyra TaxID=48 RepID=A0AAC8QBG4_9BACT|nr:Hypothetical protein AA314_05804 [Archangium gephyra]